MIRVCWREGDLIKDSYMRVFIYFCSFLGLKIYFKMKRELRVVNVWVKEINTQMCSEVLVMLYFPRKVI